MIKNLAFTILVAAVSGSFQQLSDLDIGVEITELVGEIVGNKKGFDMYRGHCTVDGADGKENKPE